MSVPSMSWCWFRSLRVLLLVLREPSTRNSMIRAVFLQVVGWQTVIVSWYAAIPIFYPLAVSWLFIALQDTRWLSLSSQSKLLSLRWTTIAAPQVACLSRCWKRIAVGTAFRSSTRLPYAVTCDCSPHKFVCKLWFIPHSFRRLQTSLTGVESSPLERERDSHFDFRSQLWITQSGLISQLVYLRGC